MNSKHGGFTLAGLALILAFAGSAWAGSEKVLYAFHENDGGFGGNVIVGPDGNLYGATVSGGKKLCPGSPTGCGVVFRLARGGNGGWRETVLHAFDDTDGFAPVGGLVFDSAGNLYGTTVYGGSKGCSNLGCGVVFELVRGKGGHWTYKMLYNFSSGGGLWPYGGLIFDPQGRLYGTTFRGGNFNACDSGCGVVFQLSPVGKGNWTETVLYSFQGTDGEGPNAPLIFDAAGSLYGTTQYGGAHGTGTVFELTLGGTGEWTEQVLYSFGGYDTEDGDQPVYGVVFDRAGDLYGATAFGGANGEQGWGTAFRLTPDKDGGWTETVLHRFDEHNVGGGGVDSGLILDAAGDLYGATASGGKYTCPGNGNVACGVAFRLTPHANGKWAETVLHSFGKAGDGAGPGGLVSDSAGHLFGMTAAGGYLGGACGKYPYTGCGVVFEVTP